MNARVSISVLPGKIFFPQVKTSANTHPTAHMSALNEQEESSSRISGARYHLVTTFGVSCKFLCVETMRARPKSQSLTIPDGVISIFADLMSLCKTLFSSRYAKPSKTCFIRQPIYSTVYFGFNMIIPYRSQGMYSNTRLTVYF